MPMTRWQAERIQRVCAIDKDYGIFLILTAIEKAEAGTLKAVEEPKGD